MCIRDSSYTVLDTSSCFYIGTSSYMYYVYKFLLSTQCLITKNHQEKIELLKSTRNSKVTQKIGQNINTRICRESSCSIMLNSVQQSFGQRHYSLWRLHVTVFKKKQERESCDEIHHITPSQVSTECCAAILLSLIHIQMCIRDRSHKYSNSQK